VGKNYFYLSKYYELLDTVFLVLRGRPLSFLHTFHHTVVVLVCWLAVHDAQAMGWITVLNNTFVHIFMYYYFGATVSGQKLWWRPWVTRIQILQFVLDGLTSLPYGWLWWTGVACRGSMRAWGVGNLAGLFLFGLFVHFDRVDRQRQAKERRRKQQQPQELQQQSASSRQPLSTSSQQPLSTEERHALSKDLD